MTNHHTGCPLASKYIHFLRILRVLCPFCPMESTELQPVVCHLVCQMSGIGAASPMLRGSGLFGPAWR